MKIDDEHAKPKIVTGSLDEEVKKLKDQMNFAIIVLLVGFILVIVSVGLFVAQSFYDARASYNTLLDKVNSINQK